MISQCTPEKVTTANTLEQTCYPELESRGRLIVGVNSLNMETYWHFLVKPHEQKAALKCLTDAVQYKWIEATNEEIGAIKRSKTWELVDLPEGKDSIGVKWVYKTKNNVEGKIDRQKARLVVKGYKQQQGKVYDETFAPVARMETVRTVLSIATQHKWKIYQMDVKFAFLNGVLKEEVYVEQPPGYGVEGQ
eukprot:PITA_30543